MVSLQDALDTAAAAAAQQDYAAALKAATQAAEIDPNSCAAQLACADAAFHLYDFTTAQEKYEAAKQIAPDNVAVWEGLARLLEAAGDRCETVKAYHKLLELTPREEAEHRRTLRLKLADLLLHTGHCHEAARHLHKVVEGRDGLPPPKGQERLMVLCMLADALMQAEDGAVEEHLQHKIAKYTGPTDAGPLPLALLRIKIHDAVMASPDGVKLTGVLAELMAVTTPSQQYVRFYEQHLSRCLVQVLAAPPRSSEREERRRAAIEECTYMIVNPRGGCCTPLPYEAAVWLLEEEEELKGGSHSGLPPTTSGGGLMSPSLSYSGARSPMMLSFTSGSPMLGSGGMMRQAGAGLSPSTVGNVNYLASTGALKTMLAATLSHPHDLSHPQGGTLGDLPPSSPEGTHTPKQAVVRRVNELGLRFIHQFPGEPAAQAVWGRILRAQFLSDSRAPSAAPLRRKISTLLATAMEAGAPTAAGWKALCGLLYQSLQYAASLRATEEALKWLEAQAAAGHEYLGQCALFLKVIHARSLLKLGRVDEAEEEFGVLADWVTEGEAAFGALGGSRPMSIHQQALRGQAQVALLRGDRIKAKQQYEAILGAALMGRGVAEHWAHAEYGWMLFEDGQLQQAEEQLTIAVDTASEPACGATETELGRHQYMLGRVYFEHGGAKRNNRKFAHDMFMEAAKHEGPHQAAALAWLGRWYHEVDGDDENARKCFQRALALDSHEGTAGDGLCAVLHRSKGPPAVRALCEGMIRRAPAATWPLRRLSLLDLQEATTDALLEGATASLQRALRVLPKDGALWEGLGVAFERLQRFSAAHKAFTKALEADAQHTPPPPLRQYAATHLAMLSAALGHPHEALKTYHTVLTTCPDNVAALMGAAETHRARAARDLTRGVSTVAAWDLSCAWQLASRACALQGDMAACWKLLGDVLVLHATATPTGALRAELETSPPNRGDLWGSLPGGDAAVLRAAAGDAVAGGACHAVGLRLAAVQRAGAAYARVEALLDGKERGEEGSGSEEEQAHWNKAQGAARLDTAAALYHEAWLLQSHPSLAAAAAPAITHLLSAAAHAIREGLQGAPGSPALWGALGMVSTDPTQQEYALCRSLQLDGTVAWVWVALGRLYVSRGKGGLGEWCFEQARCVGATQGSVWEGMGVAALVVHDTTSARRMFHQATQLGTSAQSLANWAALALAQQAAVLRRGGGGVEGGRGEGVRGVGGGDSQKTTGAPGTPSTHHPLAASQWEEQEVDMAELLSAAHNAVDLQPLNPVAHATLGSLLLAHTQPHAAVQHLRCAAVLLGNSTNMEDPGEEQTQQYLQWQGGAGLQLGVSLDLVMALVACEEYHEACAVLQRDVMGRQQQVSSQQSLQWGGWPWAAIAAAHALVAVGEGQRGVGVVMDALRGVDVGSMAWSACLITAVHLHCTHLHQPNNALTLLTSSIHTHVSIATPNMRYTWQLCVLHIIKAVQQHAGTVQQHAGNNAQSAQQYDAGVVLSAAVQCMQQLHPLEACVMADMHVILGERGVGNTGLEENDVHKWARAVHTAPWLPTPRIHLAHALTTRSLTYAPAAARLVMQLLHAHHHTTATTTPTLHTTLTQPTILPLLAHSPTMSTTHPGATYAAVWQVLLASTASSVAAWLYPAARQQLSTYCTLVHGLVHRQPEEWTWAAAAAVLQCRLTEAMVCAGVDSGGGTRPRGHSGGTRSVVYSSATGSVVGDTRHTHDAGWGRTLAWCTRACALYVRHTAACTTQTAGWDDDDDDAHVVLYAHVLLCRSECWLRMGDMEAALVDALEAEQHMLNYVDWCTNTNTNNASTSNTNTNNASTNNTINWGVAAVHVQRARVYAMQGNMQAAGDALAAVQGVVQGATMTGPGHPRIQGPQGTPVWLVGMQAALRGDLPQLQTTTTSTCSDNTTTTKQQHSAAALLEAARLVLTPPSSTDHPSSVYQAIQPSLRVVQQDTPGLAGGVHACVLLALAAARDTDRKARGRAESNASKAIRGRGGEVPFGVWEVLTAGGVGGRVVRYAVHTQPWERVLWERLGRTQ